MVECRDEAIGEIIGKQLKMGTQKLSGTQYKTPLHVYTNGDLGQLTSDQAGFVINNGPYIRKFLLTRHDALTPSLVLLAGCV